MIIQHRLIVLVLIKQHDLVLVDHVNDGKVLDILLLTIQRVLVVDSL